MAYGRRPDPPSHPELAAFVADRAARHEVPGVAVGVRHDGREYYAYHGVTSVENPLPVDAGTLFQIGATGKTVTATLVMSRAEAGEIDLDAPVRTYLPDFRVADPDVSARVTVLHLLNHTAGWDGDLHLDTGWGDDALSAYVAAMSGLPQNGPLGGLASYNDAAFCVAGRIVEVVTGLTYEAAVRRYLLDPLGMTETYPSSALNDVISRRFAVGHVRDGGRVRVARPWAPPRSAGPAGALVSTAAEQIRYARFHLGDGRTDGGARLLSAETLRRMRRPAAETAGGGQMGIAWFLRDAGKVRFAFHGGSSAGQQSAFELAPGRDFAVTVLTNAQHGFGLGEEVMAWAAQRFAGVTDESTGRVLAPSLVRADEHPAAECPHGTNTGAR